MSLGTQAKPYGKLLDYEQFIDHQIQRTRMRIKVTDIITASLTLVVGFLAVLFFEVIFDHVFGLPLFLRRVILAFGLTGACVFAAMRVALPFLRRINGIYAARTIENADPTFKNSLINYLELRGNRGQLSKAIMATLEARAVSDLAHVEVDTVVNQQRLMRTFYALSAVIVVFCLYAVFTPKSILDSARRAFLADLTRPTNTRLANIKPGSDPELAQVVAGAHVVFSADVQGTLPRTVLLHFSIDGGKFYAVRELAAGHHRYDPWQVTYPNVQQSMDYYLTGGDAESDQFHLDVLPAPTITSISHDLDFPKYTKFPQRKGVEGGSVQAIEGTKVTVHAKTNMPAVAATINMSGGQVAAPMTIDAKDPRILTGDFLVPSPEKRGTYTISFRTAGGQLNPSPVTYDIDSIADRPPTARFVQPDKPAIKVPANVKVDLLATGSDDFGVRTANLVVMNGDRAVINKDLLEDQDPKPEFKVVETVDLEKLGLKPGDAIRYKLSIADNKHPSPNKMETALQLIEVIEPVSAPEKKKFEEAQKDQEREQTTTGQEEQSQEQPDKAGSGNPDQQPSDPSAKDKAGDERGQAGKPDATPDQGADSGNANQDAGGEKEEGAGDNKNQLTPEKEKALENLLKNAKSKQLGSNKDGNPPEGQPKADGEKTNAGKQDSTTKPGKNDQTENDADPKSRDAKQPGKLEQSGRTNPQGHSTSRLTTRPRKTTRPTRSSVPINRTDRRLRKKRRKLKRKIPKREIARMRTGRAQAKRAKAPRQKVLRIPEIKPQASNSPKTKTCRATPRVTRKPRLPRNKKINPTHHGRPRPKRTGPTNPRPTQRRIRAKRLTPRIKRARKEIPRRTMARQRARTSRRAKATKRTAARPRILPMVKDQSAGTSGPLMPTRNKATRSPTRMQIRPGAETARAPRETQGKRTGRRR